MFFNGVCLFVFCLSARIPKTRQLMRTNKSNRNLKDMLIKANHSSFCLVLSQCMSHLGLNINITQNVLNGFDENCRKSHK